MIFPLWITLSILSAILFAIKDIMAKRFFNRVNIKPIDIVLHEYLLVFLIVVSVFYNKINFLAITENWFLLIGKALSVGMASYLYFTLLEKHEVSTVSPLINLSPVVLLFMSTLFLGEVITLIQLLGIGVIMWATYYLEVTMHHHRSEKPHSNHFLNISKKDTQFFSQVVLMLIVFSSAAIFDKFILDINGVDVFTNMFYTSLFILATLFFYHFKKGKLKNCMLILNRDISLLWISVLTIVSNFLVLFAIAIPEALVSLIIPLRRTSTLFSSIFGGIIFHEKHLKKKIISVIIMLIGVFLIVF